MQHRRVLQRHLQCAPCRLQVCCSVICDFVAVLFADVLERDLQCHSRESDCDIGLVLQRHLQVCCSVTCKLQCPSRVYCSVICSVICKCAMAISACVAVSICGVCCSVYLQRVLQCVFAMRSLPFASVMQCHLPVAVSRVRVLQRDLQCNLQVSDCDIGLGAMLNMGVLPDDGCTARGVASQLFTTLTEVPYC